MEQPTHNPEGNVTQAEQEKPQYALSLDIFFTADSDEAARTRARTIQWVIQEMIPDTAPIADYTYPNTTATNLGADNEYGKRQVGF